MNAQHSLSDSGRSYVLGIRGINSTRQQASLLRENSYIKALNLLLQMELGTCELYRNCSRYWAAVEPFHFDESHQRSARQLVQLIVANRGIPDQDGLALQVEISLTVAKISQHFGTRLSCQTSRRVCLQMERKLFHRYDSAIRLAPVADQHALEHLQYQVIKNREQLIMQFF